MATLHKSADLKRCFLIHYGELALKGGNRRLFEAALARNMEMALKAENVKQVKNIRGRIVVDLNGDSNRTAIEARLKKIFGIANFSAAYVFKFGDFANIKEEFKNLGDEILKIAGNLKFASFKIDARRAEKTFPKTSREINEEIGALVQKSSGAKVDLTNPDLTIWVEIAGKTAFIYTEKIQGAGGLPSGVSGRLVSLISSGFDSPLAAWRMMKRGCEIIFIHFHSYPQTTLASKENVEQIVKILAGWQKDLSAKIYFIPFLDIQKEITLKTPDELRVVLYRRFMVRIAERLAKDNMAKGLITGDSVGQVASQTLENIEVISNAASLPIFRPLCGLDKEEIIAGAKQIETCEISSRPYEDCCGLFTPEHPATRAKLPEVEEAEKSLDIENLVKNALMKAESKIVS